MSEKLFIEQREKEGGYVIRRPGADRASGREDTQGYPHSRTKGTTAAELSTPSRENRPRWGPRFRLRQRCNRKSTHHARDASTLSRQNRARRGPGPRIYHATDEIGS